MRTWSAQGLQPDRSGERTRHGRRVVWALATAMAAFAAAAAEPAPTSAPNPRCPEHCGEVLPLCLEETRKRHECLAFTDACVRACKGGAVVLDDRGAVLPGWRFREGDERTRVRW